MTVTVRKSHHVRSCVPRAVLFAQQKQSCNCKRNSGEPLPRWGFMEKHNACERHDGRAASKDGGYGGKGAPFLKKQKKCDRSRADANAGKQRIIKTSSTEFLIPSSRTPEDHQVEQNGQCRAGFDNETAETFTNVIGSKTG